MDVVIITSPEDGVVMRDDQTGTDDRRLKVLLVEDHQDSAQAVSYLLTAEGFDVEMAGNVATALDAAQRTKFDVMLIDLGLPDGTGADLLMQLRSRGHAAPAIAVSGYGHEWNNQPCFSAHLVKPVTYEQISKTISTLIADNGA
jgi:two-component system CheB/CheR fusion protein